MPFPEIPSNSVDANPQGPPEEGLPHLPHLGRNLPLTPFHELSEGRELALYPVNSQVAVAAT